MQNTVAAQFLTRTGPAPHRPADADARRRTLRNRCAGASALALSAAWLTMPSAAAAQQQLSTPPPTDYSIDERGVDLIAGTYNLSTTDVVIGDPSSGGLAYSRAYVGPGWRDSVTGTIDQDASGGYFVSIGGVSEKFTLTGGVYVPTQNVGATLVADGFGGHVFTTADGVIYVFGAPSGDYDSPTQADQGRLVSITYPSALMRSKMSSSLGNDAGLGS